MTTNSEVSLKKLELKENKQQSLAELTKLYFKGVVSFTTILNIREIYSRNLELEFNMFPKMKKSKVIHLNLKK